MQVFTLLYYIIIFFFVCLLRNMRDHYHSSVSLSLRIVDLNETETSYSILLLVKVLAWVMSLEYQVVKTV